MRAFSERSVRLSCWHSSICARGPLRTRRKATAVPAKHRSKQQHRGAKPPRWCRRARNWIMRVDEPFVPPPFGNDRSRNRLLPDGGHAPRAAGDATGSSEDRAGEGDPAIVLDIEITCRFRYLRSASEHSCDHPDQSRAHRAAGLDTRRGFGPGRERRMPQRRGRGGETEQADPEAAPLLVGLARHDHRRRRALGAC